jgi:hypothetical protein
MSCILLPRFESGSSPDSSRSAATASISLDFRATLPVETTLVFLISAWQLNGFATTSPPLEEVQTVSPFSVNRPVAHPLTIIVAWTRDPIVHGFIQESGTVFAFVPASPKESAENWFDVTTQVGCGGREEDSSALMNCMRSKNYTEILTVASQLNSAGSVLGDFAPTVDDEEVFSDYAQRAASGRQIQRPLLVGNTDYEAGFAKAALVLTPGANVTGLVGSTFSGMCTMS